jgi:predicted lysophospholipase L1 biosynthesis ABC-type transport system permease subunit
VNEQFIKEFQLGTNVIGRRIKVGDGLREGEIIGVVPTMKRSSLEQRPESEMFRAYKQICWGDLNLVVRTQRDPQELARAIRVAVDSLDRDQPIEGLTTMTQRVASSVAQKRLSVRLFGGFAAVALLLAAIGLYGVLACLVAQRTQEIGIRMALGAQRQVVLRMILRQGMTLAALGIGIGLLGAFALGGVLRGLLFGIDPNDPATFTTIVALLSGMALLACWLPARRATRVDPMIALRQE